MALTDSRKEMIKKVKAEKGAKTRTKQRRDIMSPLPTLHRSDHPAMRDDESPERSRLIRIDLGNVPGSFQKEKALDQIVQMKTAETLSLALDGRKPELPHYACVAALPGVRQQLFY